MKTRRRLEKQQYWSRLGRFAKREPLITIVLFLFAVGIAFGPFLTAHDPYIVDFSAKWKSLSPSHLFGTDNYGRDIFTRVLHGCRLEALVILAALLGAATIGVPLGMIAGYAGGAWDYWICRFLDTLLAFPPLLLAIAVVAIVGFSLKGAIVAMIIEGIAPLTRVARAATLSAKQQEYVEAAKAIGTRPWRMLARVILPNIATPLLVESSTMAGRAIMFEASLGFLGVGAQPPAPSWGAMVGEARAHLVAHPSYLLMVAGVVVIVILAFNLLGDALQARR